MTKIYKLIYKSNTIFDENDYGYMNAAGSDLSFNYVVAKSNTTTNNKKIFV